MSDHREFWEPNHWYEADNDHLKEPDVDWISDDCTGQVMTPYGSYEWWDEAGDALEDWAANDDAIELKNGIGPVK